MIYVIMHLFFARMCHYAVCIYIALPFILSWKRRKFQMSEISEKETSVAKKIVSGTLIIIMVSVMAKVMSYIAEAVNAYYIGTGHIADAFSMVTTIQNLLTTMLSLGITKVFLPAYKRHITLGENDQANRLANRLTTMLLLITACVVAVLVLFRRQVVSLFAPGFNADDAALCAELLAISSPMNLFIIMSSTYSAMLQCHNQFFGSQIREVASHIPPVLCAILLYKRLGEELGIRAMAVALIIGAMCRLLVELPFVNWKYHYRPDFSFHDIEYRHVLKKLPAAMVTAGISRINSLVDSIMASGLGEGAVSAMKYAGRLHHVFSGLLSTAISTALYPQMVELIALGKHKELSKIVTKILNIFCVLMIPVSIAGILFGTPLIQVAFERGKFDASSTALTAGVFGCYCIGLLFTASSGVLTNIFYGNGDTKTPMFISLGVVVLNIGLNFVFTSFMGISGLALATSLATFVGVIIKFILVRKHVDILWKDLLIIILKVLLASVISIVPAYFVSGLVANKYLHLLSAAVMGIAIYLAMMRILRVPAVNEIIQLLKKKVSGKKKTVLNG